MSNVFIFGLGKLGTPMAVQYASAGHQVYCWDESEYARERLATGEWDEPLVREPFLDHMWKAHGHRIHVVESSISKAVERCEVVFVIVPTPSDSVGRFSNEHVLDALSMVSGSIKAFDEPKLVVVTSTVMPGSSRDEIIPAIEEASGKKCGEGFDYCYSPEFIALGNVIPGLHAPDFVLIGGASQRASERLKAFYSTVTRSGTQFVLMSAMNAEICKLSVNCFLSIKVAFAVMTSMICERMAGADAATVLRCVGMDARIGSRFMTPGSGIGGPCLPRDLRAMSAFASGLGEDAGLCDVAGEINDTLAEVTAKEMEQRGGTRFLILGAAYRPGSSIAEASAGLRVASILAAKGRLVAVYDPEVPLEAIRGELRSGEFAYPETLEEAVRWADSILLAMPQEAFKALPEHGEWFGDDATLLDPWRMLDGTGIVEHCRYVPGGRGP